MGRNSDYTIPRSLSQKPRGSGVVVVPVVGPSVKIGPRQRDKANFHPRTPSEAIISVDGGNLAAPGNIPDMM